MLGQIGSNKSRTKRVTFNSNALYQEYSDETDSILETLELGEGNEDGSLDISLNRVQNEVAAIEAEIQGLRSNSVILSSFNDNSTILNDLENVTNENVKKRSTGKG